MVVQGSYQVARLKEIPLTERVEQTVLRSSSRKGRVTFTDAWEAVSIQFPKSLTSDSTSIKEALEQYARPVTVDSGCSSDKCVSE